jgi:hypothetical protein
MVRQTKTRKADQHRTKQTAFRLPEDLLAEVDHWCERADPKVRRTDVVISALRLFLKMRKTEQ